MGAAKARISPLAEAVGLLTAVFVLAGRWNPSRVFDVGPPSPALWPATWAAAGLLVVALVPTARPGLTRGNRLSTWTVVALNLVFLSYMMMTFLWAPDLELAGRKAYEIGLMWIAILGLYIAFQPLDAALVSAALWRWLLIITGLMAAIAVLIPTESTQRLAVLGGGPNVFGRNMGLLAIGSLVAMLRSPAVLRWLVVFAAAVLLAILSGSRGAMIAALPALLIVLLLSRVRLSRIMTLTVLGLPLVFSLVPETDLGTRALDMFRFRIGDLLIERGYTAGRGERFVDAIQLGMHYPIAGTGLAGFSHYDGRKHPHNLIAEAFCEGGTIGLLLLLSPLFATAAICLKRPRSVDAANLGAAMLLLTASQASGDLFDTRGLFVFLVLTAATVGVAAPAPPPTAPRRSIRRPQSQSLAGKSQASPPDASMSAP